MQSKQFTHYVGIDISKSKLDICLWNGAEVVAEEQCANNQKAVKEVLKQLGKRQGHNWAATLLCAEYTGMYGYSLVEVSKRQGLFLWMEHPAQIKHSMGVQRGKNDRVDAQRIARYACRFADKAAAYSMADQTISELKYLHSERELLVSDRAKYKGQLSDQKAHMPGELFKAKAARLKAMIKQFHKSIEEIDNQMSLLIKNHPRLSKQYERILSVDGAGPQVALQTIIATRGFTVFTDPRKFSCHAGVAPFAYLSGSSQHSRWRVSHRANKQLKKLFHLAALSAIKMKGELREYFLKKVAEGKRKMSVINAVRAKIIHRIFAVIKNERMYQKNYVNPLVYP